MYRIHGESGSADDVGSDLELEIAANQEKIKTYQVKYQVKDVYNMDETPLFYRHPPTTTITSNPIQGLKQDKIRITERVKYRVGYCCGRTTRRRSRMRVYFVREITFISGTIEILERDNDQDQLLTVLRTKLQRLQQQSVSKQSLLTSFSPYAGPSSIHTLATSVVPATLNWCWVYTILKSAFARPKIGCRLRKARAVANPSLILPFPQATERPQQPSTTQPPRTSEEEVKTSTPELPDAPKEQVLQQQVVEPVADVDGVAIAQEKIVTTENTLVRDEDIICKVEDIVMTENFQ